jgi:ParB-like chromosome segregation protein Spo0J
MSYAISADQEMGGDLVNDGAGSMVVARLALRDLQVAAPYRESGVSEAHVARLVELGGRWPPILVSRDDRVVIDGLHRVAAARVLGCETIDASLFDGGPDAAVVEFIRRNMHHGLPLTLRDRKQAAGRLLIAHPEWSDRRIAELCVVSPKTVGRLRRSPADLPTEEVPQLDTRFRIGRDNKRRPTDRALARQRAAKAIEAHPAGSLRSIAAEAGVSPETVRHLRADVQEMLERREAEEDEARSPGWQTDRALVSCDGGDDFLEWFERTTIDELDCRRHLDKVPLSRVYGVADEARRRAELWTRFARSLEARSAKRK